MLGMTMNEELIATKTLCYVQESQIDRIIDACDDSHWKLLFALARYAAIRFSELKDLRWKHVDLDLELLTITNAKRIRNGIFYRIIPISPKLKQILEFLHQKGVWTEELLIPCFADEDSIPWVEVEALKRIRFAREKPWSRLFDSCRVSLHEDLYQRYGPALAAYFCGYTRNPALEIYDNPEQCIQCVNEVINDQLITIVETSKLLRVSSQRVRELVLRGALETGKGNSHWRIWLSSVFDYLLYRSEHLD
jgi:hypothetical protein